MRNKLSLALTFVFTLLVFSISVSAATWIDDYTYTKDDTNKTVTLTKYTGENKNVVIQDKVTIDSNEYRIILANSLFRDNTVIESVKINDNVKGASSISSLFHNASNLKTLEIGAMDLSETTAMSNAFSRLTSLKKLDLSKLDTSHVTSMTGILLLDNLDELNLSGKFDTSSVTNMDNLFDQAKIKKIIIGKKMNFHSGDQDPAKGGSFGRGTWLREEDGKLYSTLEICNGYINNLDMSGTYIKQSDISDEIVPEFTVNYRIGKMNKMEIVSASDDSSYVLSDDKQKLFLKVNFVDGMTSNNSSVTVKYKDAVTDANGVKYDLKMTFSNYKFKDFVRLDASEPDTLYLLILNSDNGMPYLSNNFYKSVQDYLDNPINNRYKVNNDGSAISYGVEMNIVDKDGNNVEGSFIFSAYDIDIKSKQDSSTGGYGLYSEGINLISNYDKNSLTTAKTLTFLTFDPDTGRITGTRPDNQSEFSEFVVKALNGFKFEWTAGNQATTYIIGYYQPKNVLIENRNTKDEFIEGSKFEVYNSRGEKVGEWTTGSEGKSLFLNPGRYVVKQISVPSPYSVVADSTFYVGIEDTIQYNGNNVDKIVIVNGTSQDGTKCSYEVIDGKTHYYDTKGNEIDISEWSNKCQDPVPTGSFFPIYFLVLGLSFVVVSIVIVKKFTVLKKI